MSYYSRWPYFSGFTEGASFSFSAQSANGLTGTVVTLTAPTCHSPQAVCNAIANTGYQFDYWSDGNTENPRVITLTSDSSIIAYFSASIPTYIHDTTVVHDTTYVNVPYAVHDTTIVHDTTLVPYAVHDTTIVHDTTYITWTDTVTNTIHDTVNYFVYDTIINTVYDTVNNTIYDTIDHYYYDTTIVHDTTVVDNYIYDTTIVTDTLWLTVHDTLYINDTVYIHDTVYITEEGIGDVEAMNAKVYSSYGQIVVEGAEGNSVTLYDVTGRVLATRRDEGTPLRFDTPASGTYMIKIGAYPARRVVVIR